MITRSLFSGLLLVMCMIGSSVAQDIETSAPTALEQAQTSELGQQKEGSIATVDDGKLAIGLLEEFGKQNEPPKGKASEFLREKIAFSEIAIADDVQDIPIFLRGFLANRSDMRMAEINQKKLQKLYDEFGMAEEDITTFNQAKESGKWTGIDVFIQGRFALTENNSNEIRADVSIVKEGKVYPATVARTQYQTPLNMARKLAMNIEDIILASGAEERQLLSEIQKHQAVVDVANQSYEVNMIILAAGTAATLGGLYGFSSKQYILGVGGLLYGSGAWAAWFLQRMVGKEDRQAYQEKSTHYNEKYGEKFLLDKE